MNCKPGDLAFYCGLEKQHHGKIVRVVAPASNPGNGAIDRFYWRIDPPLVVGGVARVKCADVSLRPIRDPGEDATDETLLWLPVPSVEMEAA